MTEMQQAVVILTALCVFLWLPCVCPRFHRRALTTSQTEADGSALCLFYKSLSRRAKLKGWCPGLTPYNPCTKATWSGVTCGTVGAEQRVIGLTLNRTGLTGTLPSPVGQLSALVRMDLSFNSFEGSLPSSLGGLTSLAYLD